MNLSRFRISVKERDTVFVFVCDFQEKYHTVFTYVTSPFLTCLEE